MPPFLTSFLRKLRASVKSEGPPRPAKIQMPSLSNFVRTVCVPKWFEKFSDNENGGFHERLGRDFRPLNMGYKRLLTQCRQLYIYAYADGGTNRFLPRLSAKYDFIRTRYYDQASGGWAFSVTEEGDIKDASLDLYAQSFLILAFSYYAKVSGNADAAKLAHETAQLIDGKFRCAGQPGFYETLDENLAPVARLRRQNPHMHLFEACLFAYDSSRTEIYARLAHEIYALFKTYFFDAATSTLTEFFEDDLTPHKSEGHRIEAGHHFEWVWLLDYYRKLFPEAKKDAFTYMTALYGWGCRNGYDLEYGGVFDEQNRAGHALKDTKRVWPLCEAIKAHRAMRPYEEVRALTHLENTKRIFKKYYLRKDAGWNESWNRDFTRITGDYLPGTSVYHL